MTPRRAQVAAGLFAVVVALAVGTVGLAHARTSAANVIVPVDSASATRPSAATVVREQSTTTLATRGAIALVGDSLSVQARLQQQATLLATGWSPAILNGAIGRRIPLDASTQPPLSGVAAVGEVRARGADPHTWIVELGTNDVVVTGNDPRAMRSLVGEMLDAIGGGHRVVWVTVYNGNDLAASARFNAVLEQVAGARSDLMLANWAAVAATPGYLTDDDVHLTAAGQAAFARVISDAASSAALLP
jgi:hypothetical protein